MMRRTLNQKSTGILAAGILAAGFIVISFAPSTNADTSSTTVSSTIGSIINAFTTSGTVNVNATPTASGVQTINKDIVTISTNNTSGYTLKLAETSATSTLTSGSNTIAASTGTQASPIAQTANTWGYRVDGIGGFGSGPTSVVSNQTIGSLTFAGVPATASPDTVKTTATTATNDTTNIWYGVAVNTSTPSGTYTNSVTYTATTNP